MEHRTHYQLVNDPTNPARALLLSIQPASINGNDSNIEFIKNHHYLGLIGTTDIVNLVSNVGPSIDFFETMDASIFSTESRNANRQKISDLLMQYQYDKIFVSVGQHFMTSKIQNHWKVYLEEFNKIIQLFEPYQDIVYCFGETKKYIPGTKYKFPYCICNRTNRYLTNQPIQWIFTN